MSTVIELRKTLERFGGKLKKGAHFSAATGACCALELEAVCRGQAWTDLPEKVKMFDLRPINDMNVDDDLRTLHLLPVIEAYAGSLEWSQERQRHVAEKLVILTVQRIISQLSKLPDAVRQQCRGVSTLREAEAAAWAAWDAEAAWAAKADVVAVKAAKAAAKAAKAAEAATKAAWAAEAAAWASWAADKATVFTVTCEVWMEAAKER